MPLLFEVTLASTRDVSYNILCLTTYFLQYGVVFSLYPATTIHEFHDAWMIDSHRYEGSPFPSQRPDRLLACLAAQPCPASLFPFRFNSLRIRFSRLRTVGASSYL